MHANSENAQKAGLQAGVSGFAHGLWTWDSPDAPELTAPIRALLDEIAARKIAWQPTIQVLYGERDLFDPKFLDQPSVRTVIPSTVIQWHRSPAGQWLNDEMRSVPYIAEILTQGRWQEIDALPIRHVTQALRYLAERGGLLLFGTDTPSAPTYANPAGLNGRWEMDRWLAAGVSPRQIFRAATVDSAKFFGLDRELGDVAVGKRADLLLLEKNPMQTVNAYDQIVIVFSAGKPLVRDTLAVDPSER